MRKRKKKISKKEEMMYSFFVCDVPVRAHFPVELFDLKFH